MTFYFVDLLAISFNCLRLSLHHRKLWLPPQILYQNQLSSTKLYYYFPSCNFLTATLLQQEGRTGLNSNLGWALSLCVLLVHAWILYGYSDFLPQSKNVRVRVRSVNCVCAQGCFFCLYSSGLITNVPTTSCCLLHGLCQW